MLIRSHPLETHLFVVGHPELVEYGRTRLNELRTRRPPGLAVDEVVEDLMDEGATGVLVQLDGIVRVAGTSPTGDGWLTVVAHPRGHFAIAVLQLQEGAVATMANPSSEDFVAVSVVAPQAWEAELLAATVLAAGPDAEAVLGTAGVPGLLVDACDQARPVGSWSGLSAAGQPGLLASTA
ncbi:MAG TPA: FAD:protein FMN transferase [Frankiaceae bacterium]|nr:FAD:protein FMN transferase [Frankiaceae bacterium]